MNDIYSHIYNINNVNTIYFGKGSIRILQDIIKDKIKKKNDYCVLFIDNFFEDKLDLLHLTFNNNNLVYYFIDTSNEPTTDIINLYTQEITKLFKYKPNFIIGIGGGSTMDIAKAVSNLITNGGLAEDYQGWDLLKVPGLYKVGIPTISGTGAESSKTCVLINKKKGIKLGMNSKYSVFNELILDWNLTKTVDRDQYFYTGMDSYIHCIESLNGNLRNVLADSLSIQVLNLCKEVFLSDDMMSEENRKKLMIASYFGGCAIGMSLVGLVHPFSAALSVVLGLHHCVSNCIVMRAMEEFYPKEFELFWKFVETQNVKIPENICKNLSEEDFISLYNSTIVHRKPLENALGSNFERILTFEKVKEIFLKM
ncbi:MAG: iron-containing alcohol dehydrogenase family protein [Candidatus Woesearchaeota archaeon]